jgi:hypothetical protein
VISHASLVFIVIPSVFIRAATAPERRGGIRPQPFALARILSRAARGFKYDCTLGRARLSTEVRQNEATTQEGLLTNSSDMLISRVRNAHDGGLFDSRCLVANARTAVMPRPRTRHSRMLSSSPCDQREHRRRTL